MGGDAISNSSKSRRDNSSVQVSSANRLMILQSVHFQKKGRGGNDWRLVYQYNQSVITVMFQDLVGFWAFHVDPGCMIVM